MNTYSVYLSTLTRSQSIRRTSYRQKARKLTICAATLSEALNEAKAQLPGWNINMFWLNV
jgi:hypothetical protein